VFATRLVIVMLHQPHIISVQLKLKLPKSSVSKDGLTILIEDNFNDPLLKEETIFSHPQRHAWRA
jgi:hypothetical protein